MTNTDNDGVNRGGSGPETSARAEGPAGALPAVVPQFPVTLAPQPATRPVVPAAVPTAPALLRALRRRWLLATSLGIVVAAVVAGAVWFFLPPGMHTAYVKLQMPMRPESSLYGHPEEGIDFASFQRTQFALLHSRLVLNAALGKPKVRALNLEALAKTITPVEWLDKEVRVELPDGPELPRVTMVGDDPEQLKVLVTAVVDAYMEEVVQKQTAHRQERLDRLKEIARSYQNHLKQIQESRNALIKTVGTGNDRAIALKQELAQKQLSTAQTELIKVNADLMRMELEAKTYQGQDNGTIEIPDKLLEAGVDKALEKELALRAELEDRLAKARDKVDGDEFPTVRRLRAELDQKNKFLDDQRKKLRVSYKAQLLEKAQTDSQSQIALLNMQVKFHREFKSLLSEEIEHLERDAQVTTEKVIKLDDQRIDMDQAEAGVKRVMAEIDKVTVELPDPPRVKVLEEAVVITPDEVARKLKRAGLGAAAALAAVLLLVSFLEWRSRRVDSADEVVQGLGLELMGTLPAAPSRFGSRLMRSSAANAASWQSMLAESVDSARTLLLRADGAATTRVVMITSATNGEGKTSLATHLAASLARAGHRTLLIDGDLRKPAAHRIFDLPLAPGLSEVLRGEIDVAAAVRPTRAEGLWLLPAGTCDGGALQLLARDAAQGLLGRLRREYDFIVLDSSPVLAVADSLLFAQHVDGVLLSLLREVSRLPKVYLACQRLSLLRARVLGAVMNGTDSEVYGYGRSYVTV